MASGISTAGRCKEIAMFTLLFFMWLNILTISSGVEFKVGGNNGWIVPSSSKDDEFYNRWASNNRFKPNDILRFEYNMDSVLVVTKGEYEKCQSPDPLFFSNNGNTTYGLDRPGLFYFISGVSGHCDRGLKMIIKVLEPENPNPPQSANETTEPPKKSGAVLLKIGGAVSSINMIMFTLSFLRPVFM
ncbi:hypothetical protein LguiB_007639 [Lonicera macranthoides]